MTRRAGGDWARAGRGHRRRNSEFLVSVGRRCGLCARAEKMRSRPAAAPADACCCARSIVFCSVLYTFEMVLKMWGLGLWRNDQSYFLDSWCRFDFFIVLASWVDLGLLLASTLGLALDTLPRREHASALACHATRPLRVSSCPPSTAAASHALTCGRVRHRRRHIRRQGQPSDCTYCADVPNSPRSERQCQV